MKFDDQCVAEWFGLELARLLVYSCYQELVAQRYENEKRHIQQTAGHGDRLNVKRASNAARAWVMVERSRGKRYWSWRRVVLKKHRTCLAVRLSVLGTLWLFLISVGCYSTDRRLEAILRDAKRKQKAASQNTLSPTTPSSHATEEGTDAPAGQNVPVHLTWSDHSDNESNFIIERCDQVQLGSKDGTATCTGTWRTVATVSANTTEYIDKTAAINHSYIYRVKAVNSQGSSGYTETVITTPAR
jgi:hypothetical protein